MLFVLGKVLKLGLILGVAVKLFSFVSGSSESEAWINYYYGDPMERHETCPYCEDDLSIQDGFDGDSDYWECAECKEELVHPDLYSWDEMELVAYCPFCDSDLSEQAGFSDDLTYWICDDCGAELLPPDSNWEYAWFCDDCDAFLNDQNGFSESCGVWKCTECGCDNEIDISEEGKYGYTVSFNKLP